MEHVETTDRDEAVAVFSATFPGIDVRDDHDGRLFRFHFLRETRGTWTRTVLDIDGRVRMPGTYPDHLAIGRRRRGRVAISYSEGSLDTTRPYLRPPGQSEAQFEDSGVELLMMDRIAFAQRAQRLLEGTGRALADLRPDRSSPLSAAHDRLWDATACLLAATPADPSATADAVVDELAVAAVLSTFPVTDEKSKARSANSSPRVLRRATEFVREHLAEPITVVALAEAAGVSVRTVQAGFRRYLQTTPHQYIRDVRLDAARSALDHADPTTTTVAEVARRFGFSHDSRFAQTYRQKFGEHPSRTLRT